MSLTVFDTDSHRRSGIVRTHPDREHLGRLDNATDRLFDQLVRELYNLTEEEIGDACLNQVGWSVAAITAELEAEDGDVSEAAQDFRSSTEAILAAEFFYWRHQDVIDAEITLRRNGLMGLL